MRKNKPVLTLDPSAIAPANTFILTDTGSFQKEGFKIKASGIQERPGARGDFSSLALNQIEPMQTIGAGASGTVRLARCAPRRSRA